jgi:ribosomal protein L12E/L44/L45/RPP1/RPP2
LCLLTISTLESTACTKDGANKLASAEEAPEEEEGETKEEREEEEEDDDEEETRGRMYLG